MSEKKFVNGIFIREQNGKYSIFFNIALELPKLKQYADQNGIVKVATFKSKKGNWYSVLDEFKPQNKVNNAQQDFVDQQDGEPIPY